MATLGKLTGGGVRPRKLRPLEATELRDTIRRSAGQLVGQLRRHALGASEMQATQVKAAQVLLGKILPDMTAAEVTIHDPAAGKTEAELLLALAHSLQGAPTELRQAVLQALTGRVIEHVPANSQTPETAEFADAERLES